MSTTIKSVKTSRTWTMYDEPHEFFDSETGWESLRMTMDDAFEVFAECDEAHDYDCRCFDMPALKARHALCDEADWNAKVARRAVDADIYALARAMRREGWGTYLRAIERVESYYRECYHERFGK